MNASKTTSERPTRVLVVDAVRGLAVLCMIQWHCADAWIGGAIREGDAFARLRIVGGLAAPLFLLLAGLSVGLTFRAGAFAANIRRALTIAVMGYALKLFSWVVGHGAILDRVNWPAIALDAAAIALAWFGLGEKRTARERAITLTLATACAVALPFALSGTTRSPVIVTRLDVLQGIGAALVVTLCVLVLAHRTRHAAIVVGLVGLAVSLATPSFVGMDLSFVPRKILDYVARTTVDPGASGARFPLFPWAAYTLIGAAIGTVARAHPIEHAWALPFGARPLIVLGIAIALAWLVYEPGVAAQWVLAHVEQPRNLVRLMFNTSIAVAMAAVSSLLLPRLPPVGDALLSLGRHSLVVYGVHLELAYGLAAIPIQQTFGYVEWALNLAVVMGLMLLLARSLDAHDARARRAVG